MDLLWPDADVSVFVSLGIAAPMLGLALWTGRFRLGACLAAILGICGIIALIFKQPIQGWVPSTGLAIVYFLTGALRRHHALFVRSAASPRLQAMPFALVGPVLVCAWARHLDSQIPVADMTANVQQKAEAAPEPIPTSRFAQTDLGRSIRMYTRPALIQSDLVQNEKRVGQLNSFALIRTADPDSNSNCHGWIFANGQYWVQSENVDAILNDNAYHPTDSPRAGDLIIYRDSAGQVLHSGLVRVSDEGMILIESKWGYIGRYLHRPADQQYSATWTYYHSPRQGHMLLFSEDGPSANGTMSQH